MGNIITRFLFGQSSSRIVFFGLDAVGKTSLLYLLKRGKSVEAISTCGFNVETVQLVENVSFTIWDVGGGAKIRPLWRHYFSQAQGIVFIIDAADSSRFNEAKKELNIVLEAEELMQVPFLILANKQDFPGAASPSEVAKIFGFDNVDTRRVLVRGTSALTGEGIDEALTELSSKIQDNW